MSFRRSCFYLFLAWAFLSWPWLSGTVQIPYDAKAHWYPHLSFLAQSLSAGQSPFWTPHIFAGSPELADPQSALFSWPLVLLAFLSPNPSPFLMDKAVFVSILFAGLCVLAYFKDKNLPLEGGCVAALTFMFGASMGWRIQHINMVFGLALLPFTLIMLDRAFQKLSFKYGLLAGLSAALILINRDQSSLLIIYFLFFYTFYKFFTHEKPLACFPFLLAASVLALLIVSLPILLSIYCLIAL
jgi:hypothetical protein